jgi:hypothetical protein
METPRCFACERQQSVPHDELVLVITGLDADCWHYVWTCPECELENRQYVDLATAERLSSAEVVTEVLAQVPPDVLAERAEELAEAEEEQEEEQALFAGFEAQFQEAGVVELSAQAVTSPLEWPYECRGCEEVYQLGDSLLRLYFFLVESSFSFLSTDCPHCRRRNLWFMEQEELFRLIGAAEGRGQRLEFNLCDRPPALVRQVRAEQLLRYLNEAEGSE